MTGAEARLARESVGLRGQDVATELGVSQSTISRWERRPDLSKRIGYAMLHAIRVLQRSVVEEQDDE